MWHVRLKGVFPILRSKLSSTSNFKGTHKNNGPQPSVFSPVEYLLEVVVLIWTYIFKRCEIRFNWEALEKYSIRTRLSPDVKSNWNCTGQKKEKTANHRDFSRFVGFLCVVQLNYFNLTQEVGQAGEQLLVSFITLFVPYWAGDILWTVNITRTGILLLFCVFIVTSENSLTT